MPILDTRVGPKFVQENVLRTLLTNQIWHGGLQDIQDVNKKPLKLLWTINLAIWLASYNVQMNFFCMRFLSCSNEFGANFCDEFVRAIRPGDGVDKLDGGVTFPILRNGPWTQQLLREK